MQHRPGSTEIEAEPIIVQCDSPVDCSATPSYSMKWRSCADHGQKHETGDRMHFELDDQGPITEAAEPKVHFSFRHRQTLDCLAA